MGENTALSPISMSAVRSEGTSYLFYVGPDRNLMYIKSEDDEEPGRYFRPTKIKVADTPIIANKNSPQIAAVAYSYKSSAVFRVFYISDKGELQEVCQTDGQTWSKGSLDDQNIRASSNCLLTAIYGDKLKVFYNTNRESEINCASARADDTYWTSSRITAED